MTSRLSYKGCRMEYRIEQYPGGYHVTRYNPKTMEKDTVGDFDNLATAEEFKAYLEGGKDAKRGGKV